MGDIPSFDEYEAIAARVRAYVAESRKAGSFPVQESQELFLRLADVIDSLNVRLKYAEDSATAAVTGALPERFDLNQLLLAQRARSYIKWLNQTADPNDKTVPGSNKGIDPLGKPPRG